MQVLNSINTPDCKMCVDLFKRIDGTFGFEEYRRDIEDYNQWFPIGNFIYLVFNTEQEALVEALQRVDWLKDRESL